MLYHLYSCWDTSNKISDCIWPPSGVDVRRRASSWPCRGIGGRARSSSGRRRTASPGDSLGMEINKLTGSVIYGGGLENCPPELDDLAAGAEEVAPPDAVPLAFDAGVAARRRRRHRHHHPLQRRESTAGCRKFHCLKTRTA